MKLAVLIAALCTASCTAITLAPERPKPQLQRANKALALRGGGLAQDVYSDKDCVAEILATVVARDPDQPEFIQALTHSHRFESMPSPALTSALTPSTHQP